MRKFTLVIDLSNAKAAILASVVLIKGKSTWKFAKEKLSLQMESHINANFVIKASKELLM